MEYEPLKSDTKPSISDFVLHEIKNLDTMLDDLGNIDIYQKQEIKSYYVTQLQNNITHNTPLPLFMRNILFFRSVIYLYSIFYSSELVNNKVATIIINNIACYINLTTIHQHVECIFRQTGITLQELAGITLYLERISCMLQNKMIDIQYIKIYYEYIVIALIILYRKLFGADRITKNIYYAYQMRLSIYHINGCELLLLKYVYLFLKLEEINKYMKQIIVIH